MVKVDLSFNIVSSTYLIYGNIYLSACCACRDETECAQSLD